MKVDSYFLIKFRNCLYPLLMWLSKCKVKYQIKIINEYVPIKDKPIIFAVNHQAFQDTPIALKATKRRSYIYAGKQKLYWPDWLFFVLNEVIWVDRKDKRSKTESKGVLIEYLKKGQSILWFPEGTWNLTDNLLIMELKWGIIDVASRGNAQIIPVALYYNRAEKICRVNFGKPLCGKILQDKMTAIHMLRDIMGTLYYDMMSKQQILHRRTVISEKLKKEMYKVVAEYPPFNQAYETSSIYYSGRY